MIYISLLRQEQDVTAVADEECILDLTNIIIKLLDQAANQSRSCKLCVQYVRQVSLI